jgi:hypothetical protein
MFVLVHSYPYRYADVGTTYEHVCTCTNMFVRDEHVCLCSNMFVSVRTCWFVRTYRQTRTNNYQPLRFCSRFLILYSENSTFPYKTNCSNTYKHVRTQTNMFVHEQTCSYTYKHVRTRTNMCVHSSS